MTLGAADIAKISAASRADVELTMQGLKEFLDQSRWLSASNRYAESIVARLKLDHPLTAARQRDLAQYITASSVLHANDGWSYLGRAISSMLHGDAHRALHLAYYAELRGAISLLASFGIGVFNHDHYVINAPDAVTKLATSQGTHVAAWAALDTWSNQPASGNLFAHVIKPGGRPLEDWFHPHGGAFTLASQAKAWFLQWGMDLSYAIDDRRARNESSYRPDGVPTSWATDPASTIEYVRGLWSLLEPSSGSPFEGLDRHILRLAIERHFKGTTGQTPSPASVAFKGFVQATVSAQAFAPALEANWTDFLLRNTASADPLLFTLSAEKPTSSSSDHLAVISRAALLLRLASSSSHELLSQAGLTASSLSFWWTAVGDARGLWPAAAPPGALADLWADIEDALSDVDVFATNNPDKLNSVSSVAAGIGGLYNTLCSHERVALWGICPT